MKRIVILFSFIGMLLGCQKEEEFNIHKEWFKAPSYGGNTTMYIRFISDTEFEFDDEANPNRNPYLSGKGRYIRNGNDIVFDFETFTTNLFAPAYMRFTSGQWNKYPETPQEYRQARLKVKYLRWTRITNEIKTEPEEYETTFKYDIKD